MSDPDRVAVPATESKWLERPRIVWFTRVAALSSLLAFVFLCLAHVWSGGVCCGDDAFFAVVAKNVAQGRGYSSMHEPDFTPARFDPLITTGPAVILPASLLISAFGNRHWVPGLATVLLSLSLLLAAYFLLRRQVCAAHSHLVAVSFLFLNLALLAFHFEQWYALLGEVPCALFVLLAVLIWADNPSSRRGLLLVGLSFALAFLSKALSLLWFGPFLAIASGVSFWRRKSVRDMARDVATIGAGFAMPLLLFDAWKILAVGFPEYVRLSKASLADIGARGVSREVGPTIWARIENNLRQFGGRFDLPLSLLLVWSTTALAFVLGGERPKVKRVACVLYVGFCVNLLWWTAASPGWPRYAIIGVIPCAALLALPITRLAHPISLAVYLLLIAAPFAPHGSRLAYPWRSTQFFTLSERARNAESVTDYLEHEASGRTVFSHWTMADDFEYRTHSPLSFKGALVPPLSKESRDYFVLLDDRFLTFMDASLRNYFESRLGECSTTTNLAPYKILECHLSGMVSGAPPRSALLTKRPGLPKFNLEALGNQGNAWKEKSFRLRAGEPVVITGWALDVTGKSPAGGVEIALNGVPYVARYGSDRPDVGAQFGVDACRRAGFEISLDPAALPRGSVAMTVRVITADGASYYESVPVTLEVR